MGLRSVEERSATDDCLCCCIAGELVLGTAAAAFCVACDALFSVGAVSHVLCTSAVACGHSAILWSKLPHRKHRHSLWRCSMSSLLCVPPSRPDCSHCCPCCCGRINHARCCCCSLGADLCLCCGSKTSQVLAQASTVTATAAASALISANVSSLLAICMRAWSSWASTRSLLLQSS